MSVITFKHATHSARVRTELGDGLRVPVIRLGHVALLVWDLSVSSNTKPTRVLPWRGERFSPVLVQ